MEKSSSLLPISKHSSDMSSSHDGDGEPLLEDNGESKKTEYSKRPSLCLWILQFLILISSAGFFFSGLARREPTDKECAAQLSAYCMSYI